MFREAEQKNLPSALCPLFPERGFSLIELIMFIIIVSVALAGILLVMNTTTKGSADPLIHKQALVIAESLLEEVELMPFTFCDPDDVNAASAVTAADCTGGAGGANDEDAAIGPEGAASMGGAEGRYAAPQYDNVSDYNNFSMAVGSLLDIAGTAVGPTAGYSASVVVTRTGLTLVPALPTDADALRITVTVTGPDGMPVVMEGIRTRYSPRGVP